MNAHHVLWQIACHMMCQVFETTFPPAAASDVAIGCVPSTHAAARALPDMRPSSRGQQVECSVPPTASVPATTPEKHAFERESALNLRSSKEPITELQPSASPQPCGGQAHEKQNEELQDELLNLTKKLPEANSKLVAQKKEGGDAGSSKRRLASLRAMPPPVQAAAPPQLVSRQSPAPSRDRSLGVAGAG